MKRKNIMNILMISMLSAMLMAGCGTTGESINVFGNSTVVAAETESSSYDLSGLTDMDELTDEEIDSAEVIDLDGKTGTYTITEGGTYRLKGSSEKCSIVIDVDEDEDVTERSAPDYSEVALTADEMNELVGLSDRLSVNAYIKKLSDWQAANKKRSVKAYTVIRGWITQDKAAGSKSCVNFPADDNENKSYTVEKLEAISRSFMSRNSDLG